MATRNIVPRGDGEGSLGRADKKWGDIQVELINGESPGDFVNSSLADESITATQLADDAVTNAKLATMATQTVKGRATAGAGDAEDLTMPVLKGMLGSLNQSEVTALIMVLS